MKEVTITRQQYRNVCDALLNTADLNEQLLLLSTADKRSERVHRQASKLLQKFASNFRKPWGKSMRDIQLVLERWGGWASGDNSGVDYSPIAAGFKGCFLKPGNRGLPAAMMTD